MIGFCSGLNYPILHTSLSRQFFSIFVGKYLTLSLCVLVIPTLLLIYHWYLWENEYFSHDYIDSIAVGNSHSIYIICKFDVLYM